MSDRLAIRVRWPQDGGFMDGQCEVRCVPRQSDIVLINGVWLRVSNVLLCPDLIVYAHRIAVELEEEMSLMNSFGIQMDAQEQESKG